MSLRISCSIVVAGISFALAGCFGPRYTDSTVTGVLMIEGEPAPEGVRVTFSPTAPDSSSSYARTGPGGVYELWFNAGNKGANSGENVVTCGVPMQFDDKGEAFLPDDLKAIRKSLIDPKTRQPKEVIVTVEKGPNELRLEF